MESLTAPGLDQRAVPAVLLARQVALRDRPIQQPGAPAGYKPVPLSPRYHIYHSRPRKVLSRQRNWTQQELVYKRAPGHWPFDSGGVGLFPVRAGSPARLREEWRD